MYIGDDTVEFFFILLKQFIHKMNHFSSDLIQNYIYTTQADLNKHLKLFILHEKHSQDNNVFRFVLSQNEFLVILLLEFRVVL